DSVVDDALQAAIKQTAEVQNPLSRVDRAQFFARYFQGDRKEELLETALPNLRNFHLDSNLGWNGSRYVGDFPEEMRPRAALEVLTGLTLQVDNSQKVFMADVKIAVILCGLARHLSKQDIGAARNVTDEMQDTACKDVALAALDARARLAGKSVFSL